MAWTAMPTFSAGATLTAAQLNILVGNLNETAPAKATAAGQIFVSTAANAVAARTPSTTTVATSNTTTSASYVDLATTGPAVTVTTGTRAIVMVTSQLENATATAQTLVSYAVSGATTIAASDARSLWSQEGAAGMTSRASAVHLETALTAGSNTFTMKYRVSAGTGSFANRNLTVIPL